MSSAPASAEERRFACTACGRCCDRGPEIELGEAAALAGEFVLALLVRVHSLPLDPRAPAAAAWWRASGSRVPLRPALEEARRHLAAFASRRRVDRARGRELFVSLSAIVDHHRGPSCPALGADGLCTIHPRRPLTCRTVPLHYSRPPSILRAGLDRFTATPGYRCATGAEAPVILAGNAVRAPALAAARAAALAQARVDRGWKAALLERMDDPAAAARAGLPAMAAVLAASDEGFASQVAMLAAWRVAADAGLLAPDALAETCARQTGLLRAELARMPDDAALRALLAMYAGGG